MDDEREPTPSAAVAELREQASLEALGQSRLDSAGLGISERSATLSEEEYLDLSG